MRRNTLTFRNVALWFVPILLICLAVVPNAQAQSGITSIANLQYPSQAALQNGVAHVTVTFTVFYNYYMNPQGYLYFAILFVSASGGTSQVPGSGKSTPDTCQSTAFGTSTASLSAVCFAKPFSSSGTESASFTLIFNSPQNYALRAYAAVLDQSGNVVAGAGASSSSDFAITVTGQTQPSTTTSTPTLPPPTSISTMTSQTSQYLLPPSTSVSTVTQTSSSSTETSASSTQTSNTLMGIVEQNQLLILGAAVLLAAVIIAVALRGRQKPTPTQPTKTSTTPGMIYCEQCGTRNPTTNDFCLKCGTKLN